MGSLCSADETVLKSGKTIVIQNTKVPLKVTKGEAIEKLNQNIHFGTDGTPLFTEVFFLTKG